MVLRLLSFLIAALLLATIGFQAIVPAESAAKSHGSAFGAQTYEVALAPHEEVRTTAVSIDPFAPDPLTIPLPVPTAAMLERPAPRAQSTGPPAASLAVRLPHPRAPPLA
jgi:hypothetical protein